MPSADRVLIQKVWEHYKSAGETPKGVTPQEVVSAAYVGFVIESEEYEDEREKLNEKKG